MPWPAFISSRSHVVHLCQLSAHACDAFRRDVPYASSSHPSSESSPRLPSPILHRSSHHGSLAFSEQFIDQSIVATTTAATATTDQTHQMHSRVLVEFVLWFLSLVGGMLILPFDQDHQREAFEI